MKWCGEITGGWKSRLACHPPTLYSTLIIWKDVDHVEAGDSDNDSHPSTLPSITIVWKDGHIGEDGDDDGDDNNGNDNNDRNPVCLNRTSSFEAFWYMAFYLPGQNSILPYFSSLSMVAVSLYQSFFHEIEKD